MIAAYLVGSRLFQCHTKDSDYDLITVVDDATNSTKVDYFYYFSSYQIMKVVWRLWKSWSRRTSPYRRRRSQYQHLPHPLLWISHARQRSMDRNDFFFSSILHSLFTQFLSSRAIPPQKTEFKTSRINGLWTQLFKSKKINERKLNKKSQKKLDSRCSFLKTCFTALYITQWNFTEISPSSIWKNHRFHFWQWRMEHDCWRS